MIQESTIHSIEKAGQWPTSVALDTHTLMGLGGVDIIGRLSKIEIIIKKFFLKVRYWIVNVPTVGRWSVVGTLQ